MANIAEAERGTGGMQRYQGGLAATLVRTLLIFTFIPLILMGGAAYLRARTLLRDQVVRQMQAQLTDQVGQVDLSAKTKEIRLDRIVRSADFLTTARHALASTPPGPDFTTLQSDFSTSIRSASPEGSAATFNQYFLIAPNGSVAIATNPAWHGLSLQSLPLYKNLTQGDHQSFSAYDPQPLYTNQLVLFTVSQINSPDGSHLGTLVGVTESQELQTILRNLATPNSGAEALFVTQDGEIIGTDPYTNEMTRIQAPTSESAPIMAALNPMMNQTTVTPASVTFTKPTGTPAFGQVLWLNSLHSGIVYEIDENRIFGALTSLIPFTILIILAALLAMGIVLSIGAQRVFRPLVGLTQITRRIANGDFNQRAEVRSNDEIGLLAHSFNQMAEELEGVITGLEQRVAQRTRDLQLQSLRLRTAAEVARDAALAPSLEELLDRAARLMLGRFDLHHVGIFLADDRKEYLVLQAAPSEIGRHMLADGYRIRLGDEGAVSQVTTSGEPRLITSADEDSSDLGDPYHEATRSQLVLPLRTREGTIGALDLQSNRTDGLGPADTSVMQVLADALAAAIERSRFLLQVQTRLKQLFFNDTATTEKALQPFGKSERAFVGYTYDNIRLEQAAEIPDDARHALEAGKTHITESSLDAPDATPSAAVPIRLRGQTLGVIHVNFRRGQAPRDTVALIEQAADRIGTGIENVRLLEDSVTRANKERVIGSISAKIGSSLNVRNILQTAVEELGHALPGSDVSIRLRASAPDREKESPA